MKNKTISLAKFLARHMMMTGDGLKEISHIDVKFAFPGIQICPIDTQEELCNKGKAVRVFDGKETITYIIPEITEMQALEYALIKNLKRKKAKEEKIKT